VTARWARRERNHKISYISFGIHQIRSAFSKHPDREFLALSTLAILFFLLHCPTAAGQSDAEAKKPFVVDKDSHVVVMEYEAWFGPNAVTLENGNAAVPLLKSADMENVGGGYDSADPAVIRQHVKWMEDIGVDAALVDLTNNVSCIFNSEEFVNKFLRNENNCPVFRSDYQNIRNNTGNLYPAWSRLRTRLKLIPLLGGIDQDVLIKDIDGKTAFEKEVEYFGGLMSEHPGRNVIYQGKPLMVIYLGAAQDPTAADNPLWLQLREFLKSHPALSGKYTFKMMAGFLDSQPALWATQGTPDKPVEINPVYGFWSWVDRLNPTCTGSLCPYFPTFNKAGARVENFTVALATMGQDGWGCPNAEALPYCEDDALRLGVDRSYTTFDSFMEHARELDPIFLFIHQFNEFQQPDEGFDAKTNDEVEPANLWGDRALEVVKQQIALYHRHHHHDDRGDDDGDDSEIISANH